eukprot:6414583-Amphidinium_carterae.4
MAVVALAHCRADQDCRGLLDQSEFPDLLKERLVEVLNSSLRLMLKEQMSTMGLSAPWQLSELVPKSMAHCPPE